MTQITHENTATGNAIPSLESVSLYTDSEKETQKRCRRWHFRLSNYTDDEITQITQRLKCYIIGKEIGPKSGTPHLQCYTEFSNAPLFKTLKAINPRIKWIPAKGSRKDNLLYCSKDGNYISTWDIPKPEYKYNGEDLPTFDELYEWEIDVMKILAIPKVKGNNRQLHWIQEPKGGVGKTTFCKYLEFHNEDTLCYTMCSKSADILTVVDSKYTAYVFDFPRTLGPDFCPYTALEMVLSGVVDDYKLKKERRKIRFAPPHVIVFSNFLPNFSKCLSLDRWKIYTIENNNLITLHLSDLIINEE